MLGNVPVDASDEGLMVSALLHEAIPPSFVRLTDPDGETVVSKVMELDVEVSKYDLLVTLDRAARHEGDGAAETIEGALDTLADIDDVEGLGRAIEDHWL